jgi:hypothetical protein
MTQQSPECIASSESPQHKAQVLPFERPQSDIQRAVQQRAQEAMELNRARSKFRVTPLRWLLIFAIATIPIFLTSAAMDGVLRGMHLLDAMYEKQDAAERAKHPPAATETEETQEPGVVMLKPLSEPTPAPPPSAH